MLREGYQPVQPLETDLGQAQADILWPRIDCPLESL